MRSAIKRLCFWYIYNRGTFQFNFMCPISLVIFFLAPSNLGFPLSFLDVGSKHWKRIIYIILERDAVTCCCSADSDSVIPSKYTNIPNDDNELFKASPSSLRFFSPPCRIHYSDYDLSLANYICDAWAVSQWVQGPCKHRSAGLRTQNKDESFRFALSSR